MVYVAGIGRGMGDLPRDDVYLPEQLSGIHRHKGRVQPVPFAGREGPEGIAAHRLQVFGDINFDFRNRYAQHGRYTPETT